MNATGATDLNVLDLAKSLIAIPSESYRSNQQIADFLAALLSNLGYTVEPIAYTEAQGKRKVSLAARAGSGQGGLGLFAHSDTVPATADGWTPFTPIIQDDKLIGRGACDMKGPLAAALVAAASFPTAQLRAPLTLVITSDEEEGYGGAYAVCAQSQLLAAGWPEAGVVIEPTRLRPVYAHKGMVRVTVTAEGVAAHTSTGRGVSANFLIAPFLAEMTHLAERFSRDKRFMNGEFNPPTNGFNMVIDDGGCPHNVTAARTVCTMTLRTMPDDHRDEALALIAASAQRHNLAFASNGFDPVYTPRDSDIVRAAVAATDAQPETASYGTEAAVYKDYTSLVVLGPGSIDQAHTHGEWIEVSELQKAVNVYRRLIRRFCL